MVGRTDVIYWFVGFDKEQVPEEWGRCGKKVCEPPGATGKVTHTAALQVCLFAKEAGPRFPGARMVNLRSKDRVRSSSASFRQNAGVRSR